MQKFINILISHCQPIKIYPIYHLIPSQYLHPLKQTPIQSLYKPLQKILNQNNRILLFTKKSKLLDNMTQGKNKKNFGKKGQQKKKTTDSLSKKQWFQLRAPAPFQSDSFGYTCANRTQGQRKVQDNIKGRVVTSNQADLDKNQQSFIWRKIKLIIDDTRGFDALTSFYGADMTRDQLCSLIKKRKTLIQAIQDCKSADGYVIRVFVIAFTRQSHNQKKKTNYALASQQKSIRKKINQIVNKQVSKSNATQLLNMFTCESTEKQISKQVSPIYPLKSVKIRKVKVIQRPKIEVTKLMQMHQNEKRNLGKNEGKKIKFKKTQKKPQLPVNQSTNLLSRQTPAPN